MHIFAGYLIKLHVCINVLIFVGDKIAHFKIQESVIKTNPFRIAIKHN